MKRPAYIFATVLLCLSVLLALWQGSFNLRQFVSNSPLQTLIFWAISSLNFVLMVTLGFILFRTAAKLYIEWQSNREGSRIKTKLVIGALALSFLPVVFMVLWGVEVLNFNLKAWFSEPVKNQLAVFTKVSDLLTTELQDEVKVKAALLASLPETRQILEGGRRNPGLLDRFAKEQKLQSVAIYSAQGTVLVDRWGPPPPAAGDSQTVTAHAPVTSGSSTLGDVVLGSRVPVDVAAQQTEIRKYTTEFDQNQRNRKDYRLFYTMLLLLIALFVLYVATWMALFLAKQISVPITKLLDAAREVRKGNLKHRVQVRAIDELALLVKGFNQMTEELEANSMELDRRQRFTEAILESIPTGVLSIGSDGSIQLANRALAKIFPDEQVARATRLEDLFSREDTAEIKYMMKRARRTGISSRQLELRIGHRNVQIAVTVSALEDKLTSGFVMVLEDTSELFRAQKAAAWHEVARRVAHEIKNPLTPIALSAERINRQIDRVDLAPGAARILHECAATISKSVDSVKMLVDEFSTFARFPAAQPVRGDLNEQVSEALAVFHGRLDGIRIRTSFAAGLPPVSLDREQFQRVVVNLVDNAAEAMQDSLVKELYIATQAGSETVELIVADSGPGITAEDKEKLFLPYFSTKNRGTGLGLAIVNHILSEHHAQIRVEDNQPAGARFTVEIPALIDAEPAESGAKPAAETGAKPAAAKV
ncbi:MAG TPA: ATP-binding protein [Bryobacteraceae bacterium]|jgi:PAS domain S-box-containing protein|nr:ATP-binding protein [Bryobacteraceae bacterium]